MNPFGLYIHIPFCERKCFYCDFVSFPRQENNISTYINNVIKEISLYKDKLQDLHLDTIFIGGGTPSSIDSKYIKQIMDHIYNTFSTELLKEVTIEVNPGMLDKEKARVYKEIGINRISLGLQSLNDNLLKSIGRIHTSKEFLESLEILRNEGFNNINVDLMFGLPQQTKEDLEMTISKVMDLDIEHISLYGLIIEEGTLLNNWYKKGILELPGEDLERYMYHNSIDLLRSRGYHQYEISNFSKTGNECLHNITYWKVKPYLGIGLSSHSNLFGKRFWNHSNLKNYNDLLNNNELPIEGQEDINQNMEIAEYCIMGLRLINGIDKIEFKNRFELDIETKYGDIIKKHRLNGLLVNDDKNIRLTSKGLDLSNIVEVDFMP